MIRYIFLGLVFIASQAGHVLHGQNKIKWVSWEEAIEKSKKDKKKIFIDVYTEWCGWCKKMDKSTFSEDHIARYMNENYYAVKFDAEMNSPVLLKGTEYKFVKNGTKGYHELAVHLLQGQMSYPSMVFLDEEFNMIQAIPGYQDVQKFEMIITYFGNNNHKSVPWHKYMQSFQRRDFFTLQAGKKE
ncbi:MAG: DUF255 domain-containing protein [Saprospiraceae bacterium]|nr:DUF255 domain-containing protein [Saprospiraceae bacterium]